MNAMNARTFVSTMPLEEMERIMGEADALEACGDKKGAQRLRLTVPLNPKVANEFKRILGLQALIDVGLNLDDAVAMYGKDWLNG